MITGKAIPICRTAFQGESLMSSSPKSVGALSSSCSPRRKSGYGLVTMAYAGASVRDPHSTLGVSPGASKHEIKKAYRRLALKFHPDVCDGNHCTTNFQQINFAYEVCFLSLTISPLRCANGLRLLKINVFLINFPKLAMVFREFNGKLSK